MKLKHDTLKVWLQADCLQFFNWYNTELQTTSLYLEHIDCIINDRTVLAGLPSDVSLINDPLEYSIRFAV